jgi:hypothetical protein
MNSSVCRVMVGVASLAGLGMTATLAGAQTDEAFAIPTAELLKEKPRLYRYESYWAFPPAHWGEVDKDNATGNQKVLAPALADGTLLGYGDSENLVNPGEGFTHDNWWHANSYAGLTKVLEAFQKGGGSSSPLLVSSTKHWSQVYVSRFYNWKAGSWKGAYEYRRAYKLKPEADANGGIPALSSFYVPVLEKLFADGTIVEYEIDRDLVNSTESAGQFILVFVTPNAEGRDKYNATYNAALYKNALLAPAKASILFDETPHDDWVRVNVTYK